jgi:hypothetical protein
MGSGPAIMGGRIERMTKAVLDIRVLAPAYWQAYWRIVRDTRLRALSDSPDALTSHYQLERR